MRMLRNPILAVGLLIGVTFAIAGGLGGAPAWQAALTAIIPIAYALLVTLLARRSDTASVLAGRPVDERWMQLNLEASAGALGLTALVGLAAFVVAEATGRDWVPYAFMCAVMALGYVGGLAVLRIRG
jgi:hypothetical protein